MRKFTIFTVLLTVVIIVVAGQILVNEYLPDLSDDVSGELSVSLPDSLSVGGSEGVSFFGSDLADESEEITFSEDSEGEVNFEQEAEDRSGVDETPVSSDREESSGPPDFEDISYGEGGSGGPSESVFLREEQVKSAGFVGAYIEPENHEDLLFKTVAVDDIDDIKMDKFAVRTDSKFLAKVYVFRIGVNTNVRDVYQLLRSKASQGTGVQINETNEFGINSFYMNDSRRTGVAFLTVRIGSMIYSFSYPHDYHSQIKNLIQLLEWEIG